MGKTMKERADKLLVSQGLAESRQKAQALIMAGLVYKDGERIEKPGQWLGEGVELRVRDTLAFVSRGGIKLAAALDGFSLSVQGKTAADLGSSTGGFTDCLLQRGARKVYAVDVDTRQLDWKLQQDSRVVKITKNARFLSPEDFSEKLHIVAMDLSFISVLKVLPAIKASINNGYVIALIKPQFEAGRKQVGKKGIIRDSNLHAQVLNKVIAEAEALGYNILGLLPSPIRGQKGNREFLVLWSTEKRALPTDKVQDLIKEAVSEKQD